jgi:aryl-alcohol dehydrogenase-like predicted oxidoreductase
LNSSAYHASRLIIGTAQFGTAYGVTNTRGQISEAEVCGILETAGSAGIGLVDTAPVYGTSESVLGKALERLSAIGVITKTPVFDGPAIGPDDVKRLRYSVAQSLERLRRPSVDGLLIHHGTDLRKSGSDRVIDALMEFRSEGVAERIGVSIYDEAELDDVLTRFQPDIVQLPLNLFDQRLLRSGALARLKSRGIEIHARSVFLQGILIGSTAPLHNYFKSYQPHFDRYRQFLSNQAISPLAACLGFALAPGAADRIVVGVTGQDELADILNAAGSLDGDLPDFGALAVDEPGLVDPRRWKLSEA